MIRLTLVLVLAFLVSACNSQTTRTASPQESNQVYTPPTYSPASDPPTSSATIKGALGLPKADWDKVHGSPKHNPVGWDEYEGGKYVVMFMDGSVWHLERVWDSRSPASMDAARAESKLLIPEDSILLKTYTASGDRTVDLYKSQWLMDRLKGTKDQASLWNGGEPGNFIVLYRAGTGKVSSIVMGLGNNP